MFRREVAVCLATIALSVFLGEQVLRLLEYPSTHELQVAHPKNYFERRESIEFEIDFRTNSQGLRYQEIPLEKPTGETRVLVLGDSFTEGVGVEANETFSAHLEEYFSNINNGKVRFINGGLAGTGPLQYWRLFYRIGAKYDPDVVLVSIYANDVSNMRSNLSLDDLYKFHTRGVESKEFGLKKLLQFLFPRTYTALAKFKDRLFQQGSHNERGGTGEQWLVEQVTRAAEEGNISQKRIEEWRKSLDRELLAATDSGKLDGAILSFPLLRPRYLRNAIDLTEPEGGQKYRAMLLVLQELAKVARANGTRVWMIYIPSMWQYDSNAYKIDHPWEKGGLVSQSWLENQTEIQKRLKDWTSEQRIAFLDLTPPLRQATSKGESLNFPVDGHWNPVGHAIAAKIIRNWILELGLLNSSSR